MIKALKCFLGFMIMIQIVGSVSAQIKLDLTNVDPGRYDQSWWNRAPYRLVQTNLREFDATMDVDAYVQSMVDASASIVLINVGGIVANYPTELPFQYRNTFMKGDLVGDLIKGLHAKGIKVIGRFDFSKINETLAAKKPEWLYVSQEGKNVNYNGQVHTCINGGYQQEYGKEILKEAINRYPLDGVFFNMIGYTTSDYSGNNYGICQCDNCKKRFKDSTGYELPTKSDPNDIVFRTYNDFKKKTSDKLFKEIGSHIKALNPNLMINTYADAGVDMIASESGSELGEHYEWNYSATDNVKRVLGSYKDRSPGNLLIYFQAIGYRHVGTSPHLAKIWMLENMLNGAPLGFVVVGTLVNYEDRVFIPTLNNLYGFHKKNEKLFTNLETKNSIALIRGSNREEYQGMIKLLTEEHFMYDVVEASVLGTERMPKALQDYELVILPDMTSMDNRMISIIDDYVNSGGKILSTGATSTRDALGKPLNKIRLKSLGVNEDFELFSKAKSTYLKIYEKDKSAFGALPFKDFSIMMVYSDFLKTIPLPNATSYMRFLPATRFGPPEKAYFLETDITDYPGAVKNQYGKGLSLFIPWQLGAQYYQKAHYTHRSLFTSAITEVLKVKRTVSFNTSSMIELTHLVNRDKAFEWFGMINHSGQVGATLGQPIPVYNATLRFRPQKPLNELLLATSGKKLQWKQIDGLVEVVIPNIGDYEMLVALYK